MNVPSAIEVQVASANLVASAGDKSAIGLIVECRPDARLQDLPHFGSCGVVLGDGRKQVPFFQNVKFYPELKNDGIGSAIIDPSDIGGNRLLFKNSATENDVFSANFRPITGKKLSFASQEQIAGGSPERPSENGDSKRAKSGHEAVTVVGPVTGAFKPDLDVSENPFEREETFLLLLIAGVFLVAGITGLESRRAANRINNNHRR